VLQDAARKQEKLDHLGLEMFSMVPQNSSIFDVLHVYVQLCQRYGEIQPSP